MDKFTPEYIQNVQQIIKNDEKDKARELLKDLHPADIAELYQQLNLDEAEYIYMLLDGEKAADVLLELDEDDREKMLKQLPSEVIAKQFIDYMIPTMPWTSFGKWTKTLRKRSSPTATT